MWPLHFVKRNDSTSGTEGHEEPKKNSSIFHQCVHSYGEKSLNDAIAAIYHSSYNQGIFPPIQ